MSAITNSPAGCGYIKLLPVWWLLTLILPNSFAGVSPGPTNHADLRAFAAGEYSARQSDYKRGATNDGFATRFARACFELAEFSTNATERATLAGQGIAACRELLGRNSNSAPARLYLAMNLGQLARTKTLGALAIVDEMELQFTQARRLDKHLEHAAPDRYLGLLYREAPVIVSVGNRGKARQHLLRAVEFAPEFPPNRLNLAESYLAWGEKPDARWHLRKLEALLPAARTNFTGTSWAAPWADWDQRIAKVRRALQD